MQDLKKCPCGSTPKSLQINAQDRDKWAFVSGDCCGEWSIEYRNNYARVPSEESTERAREAWNNAPRAALRQRPVVDDAMVERAAEAWLVNTARKAGAHGVSFEQESMMRLGFEAGYKSALLDCSR